MTQRLEYTEDTENDCITITDNKYELLTSFDSEIVLSPAEDAITVVNELNTQYAIVEMLKEQLSHYNDMDDIEYWIQETKEKGDDGKMTNPHKNCEYYVAQNDMCMLYYQFNYHDVSQYTECLTKIIYKDKEE